MQCSNCGTSVNPGAKFCPNCATPIAAGPPAGQQFPGQQNYGGGQGYQGGQQAYPGPQNYPAGYQQPGPGYPAPGYGGPAYAQPSSNKTPIILAIVLLVLIGGGVAAYFLWFNKSDNTTQQASSDANTTASNKAPNTPVADRPGDVIKELIRAMERGSTQEFVNLLVEKERAALSLDIETPNGNPKKVMNEKISEAAGKMRGWGGVKTIEIKNEQVTGDTATVSYQITYNNGLTEPGSMNLAKEKGQWKVQTTKG
jgi:hypothetical protein